MAPLGSLLLGVTIGVLVVTDDTSASVFFPDRSDQVGTTFTMLAPRQCLPADLTVTAAGAEVVAACTDKVTTGAVPAECDGATLLAVYFNCFAVSIGVLSAGETSFNSSRLEQRFRNLSNDSAWQDNTSQIIARCDEASSYRPQTEPGARREAVYISTCVKWGMFTACDLQQEQRGALDAEGKLRRVRFFSGDCPLSPRTLKNTLERVTGRTLEGCSRGLYRSRDVHQLYEAQIASVVCLLGNFIDYSTPNANINFYMLNKAIQNERRRTYSQHADQLLRILHFCDYCDNPREFVECWANEGVLSCAFQQANQVADQLPDSCLISVPNAGPSPVSAGGPYRLRGRQ